MALRLSKAEAAAYGFDGKPGNGWKRKLCDRKPTKGQLAFAAVAHYCARMGHPTPVAEYKFHLTRRWKLDCAWPSLRLGLEFQGGGWVQGRHTRGVGHEADCEKFSEAASMGWRVMLVTYKQLKNGKVYGWLDRIVW
jgi:hypothetical protein